MFNWLAKLLAWLKSRWSLLPEETRGKVIDAFVESLDAILRSIFQNAKEAK